MDDIKFFSLYNELKKDEKTRFLKWIKQHYDKTEIETFFLNVIEKDRREKFPLSEQEKMQKIWDKSFPKKAFNKKTFDNKLSELATILDNFLIYESLAHPIIYSRTQKIKSES
jgi:prolyl oligopeptidase PreP (S9A serine peptidase family)